MAKRILCLLIATFMTIGLTACNLKGDTGERGADGKKQPSIQTPPDPSKITFSKGARHCPAPFFVFRYAKRHFWAKIRQKKLLCAPQNRFSLTSAPLRAKIEL